MRSMLKRAALAVPFLLLLSCGSDTTAPDVSDLRLRIASGNGQLGPLGRSLASPLEVVVSRDGSPASGVGVVWKTDDGALVETSTTDSVGVSRASWTLPRRSGRAQATARIDGSDIAVTFWAEGAYPALTRVGGNDQTGVVGEALADSLRVRVTWNGTPLANEPVQWSISTALVPTDSDGVSSVQWRLAEQAGEQQARAFMPVPTSPGGISGTPTERLFTATAIPGPMTRLEVELPRIGAVPPTHWTHGSRHPLTATAFDAYNNRIAGVAVTWEVAAGEGTIQVQEAATAEDGRARATFVGPAGYTGAVAVRASAPGFSVESGSLEFTDFLYQWYSSGWWAEEGIAPGTTLTVSSGSTVRWANNATGSHRLLVQGDAAPATELVPGMVYERTFATAGTYQVTCTEHSPYETFTVTVTP